MIEIFNTQNSKIEKIENFEKNSWISVTNPSPDEIKKLTFELGVLEDFLIAPLDSEEVSRLEIEEDELAQNNQTLILINASIKEELIGHEELSYITMPVAIILMKDYIITVTLKELNSIELFKTGKRKDIDTSYKTRFTLQLIYQVATQYLIDLRTIDRYTNRVELFLREDMKNEHLFQLLALEKNLVYFSTALKSNETVVKKINRSQLITKYESDEDLLEDTLIELLQASEMAQINSMIIRSIRDAFSSIISNNLNSVMKILASLTIILTIPTMVFSFFGMNTYLGGFVDNVTSSITILLATLIITYLGYKIMKKKNMF